VTRNPAAPSGSNVQEIAVSEIDETLLLDQVNTYWREGTALIEACLAKAIRADVNDAPIPLIGAEAKAWHYAQAEAYRHALEMMGVPEGYPECLALRQQESRT
jgi:hypothetical protein